jgi:hypothetical protein
VVKKILLTPQNNLWHIEGVPKPLYTLKHLTFKPGFSLPGASRYLS